MGEGLVCFPLTDPQGMEEGQMGAHKEQGDFRLPYILHLLKLGHVMLSGRQEVPLTLAILNTAPAIDVNYSNSHGTFPEINIHKQFESKQ